MEDTAVEKSRADVIMERKLRLVKEQASIVLSPKMRDLHLLTQILFTTDKTINRMRMNAGTVRMPLFELEEANERITRFTSKVRAFTSAWAARTSTCHPAPVRPRRRSWRAEGMPTSSCPRPRKGQLSPTFS